MKKAILAALLALSTAAHAGPGATECGVTTAIDSPAGTFFKLPVIIANPLTAFAFAASSYRNSLCPRAELITREQAQAMIDEAVARQVAEIVKAQQAQVLAEVLR